MVILTQTTYKVNDQIPAFATPAEVQRERAVRSIAARAVNGDLANWPLDAVAGLLMLAGATWAGACIWWDLIALQRAALVTLPAGLMVEVWL